MNFLSKCLGRQTNVTVILPTKTFNELKDDLDYKCGMTYQTLWLLHGFSGDQEDYIKFSNIVRYAEDNKLAVIMPAAYNAGYTDDPHGAKYMSFITDELMSLCQAYFPLSLKREDNFIGGLSMGGAGTMKIACAYPEKFGYALCMSGACSDLHQDEPSKNWFGTDPKTYQGKIPGNSRQDQRTINDAFFIAQKNIQQGKVLPHFYITTGNQDFALEKCKKAATYLHSLGCKVDYEEVDGYGHEWDFWDLSLRKAISQWFPLKRKPIFPNYLEEQDTVTKLSLIAKNNGLLPPTYDFRQSYDKQGYPIWRCRCQIEGYDSSYESYAPSKEEAKKEVADKMLKDLLKNDKSID